MNITHIEYWVRVSDSAFMEVSPKEIAQFIADGFIPEIRVHPRIKEESR